MSVWLVVAAISAGTVALKGVGPVVLGDRPLPEAAARILALLPPPLLAALIVTQTFVSDEALVLDERVVGLLAAIASVAARLPLLVTLVAAAAATALGRAFL